MHRQASRATISDPLATLIDTIYGWGVNSATRLTAFMKWADQHSLELECDPSVFWAGLHQAWSSCDDTWNQRDELLELMESYREWLGCSPCDFLAEDCDKAF